MQLFDAKVNKDLIQEWTSMLRRLGSPSQKKPTAELTERVSNVLDGVPPPISRRKERSTVEYAS